MMKAFTEGIDKIYYDLDNVDDLQSRLHFEGRLKDTGKAVLPWAAAAALGYGITQSDPQMSTQDKFENASAIYQFTVISDQSDPDESAKQFVNFALTLPSKDRRRLKDHLENFNANIPRHRRARMEEFQQSINYWVNQFNVDRWSAKDESNKRPVTESTGEAGQYADTWLHDHRDEIETAPENIGIEDIIHRIADDYADTAAEPVSNAEAQEIVNVVEPALTNDYGWILDPDSDILSRYTTVDEDQPAGTSVPAGVEGQPMVHTDADFLLFLEWVVNEVDENGELKYNARSIVDIITSPHDPWVVKLYKRYKDQSQRIEDDPYL